MSKKIEEIKESIQEWFGTSTDAKEVCDVRCIRHAFSKISEYDKANYFGDVKYSNMGYISIIAWKERGKE